MEGGPNRIPKEAREILDSMSSAADSPAAMDVIPINWALTNRVFRISWGNERSVLLRIYGEGMDVFFSREDEIRTFEFMSERGQGPGLLRRFSNGRVEEFIHARTLSATDLRDPEISALIASKLAEFHDLDMYGSKTVHIWDRLRNWLKTAQSLCSAEEVKEFCLDVLAEEINSLEKSMAGADQKIGFCHNDLQCANIMIDEETRKITIIDYEYASFNPTAFDVANYFREMATDYNSVTPHILDYSKYPDVEERKRFVHIYMKSSGADPSEEQIMDFLKLIEKYGLAAQLYCALWCVISEHVNRIPFNYVELVKQQLGQYWLRKPTLLGSN